MFDVFLSHNGQDKAAVEVLAERLRAEAGLRPFLDKWHLVPGTSWQPHLEEALAKSLAVAVFFGPTGVAPWHNEEVRVALANAVRSRDEYRVIPVLLPGARTEDITGFLAQRTWVDFRAGLDDAAAFERLVAGVKGHAPENDTFQLPDEPAPYRGLLPFGKRHSRFFFGRDSEIETVLARLRHFPFLAVVGASGEGKSSLVHGGVLPRLKSSGQGDDAPLRARTMTPGGRPLRALADQLATLGPPEARLATADVLRWQLASRRDAFRTAVSTLTADQPGTFLLVVDQLEELFTYAPAGSLSSSATAFLDNLWDAVERGGGAIQIIVTLRADFFERCLRVPTLRALLQDRQLLLGSMGPEALRDAIIQPAQAVGAFLERGLVSAILKDVSQEPGSLPLLEHALYELWRARSGAWLTLSAYETSGGVAGALQRRAQACYEALSPPQREIAKRLFLRLTTLGEGTPDTRRRILSCELRFPGVDSTQVQHVLQALSGPGARLIVVHGSAVEVAHEVLIQTWSTLRGWLDENRRLLSIHRRLTDATHEWAEHQRDASYLYTGARLLEAEECFSGTPWPLNERERDFLDASVERRDEEKRAEERRRQAELEHTQQLARVAEAGRRAEAARAQVARRATQRLRVLALVLTVGSGGIFSFWKEARQERDMALSRELTANALLELKEDPQRSLLLIQQAHSIAPTEHVPRALSAWQLEPALLVVRDTTKLFSQATFHPDGSRIIAANSEGTVRIWNVASGRPLITLRGHTGAVGSVRFDTGGARAVTASLDGTARVWDAASGKLLATLSGHTDTVWDARFSPDGARIITLSRDGTVRTWEASSGRPLLVLARRSEQVGFALFSPDSTRVITASSRDGTVRIREVESGRRLVTLPGHSEVVLDARFNPEGTRIVTASQDGMARLWIAATGGLLATLSGHTGAVRSAAFSPDGTRIVTASLDGTARLWSAATGEHLTTLVGHTGPVVQAIFRPDGARVVTASKDGTARLWDVASGQLLTTLSGHTDAVQGAAFSPDGKRVVTYSLDGTARLWNAAGKISTILPGTTVDLDSEGARAVTTSDDGTARLWEVASGRLLTTLSGHSGPVLSGSFSPDGTRVVTTSRDETARLWDAASGRLLATLSGHTQAVWNARFSSDGARVVTASLDGTARLWDAATGGLLVTFSGHAGEVWDARFSEDGAHIVTANMDGTARLWDAATGGLLVTFSGHAGLVADASFSPDGRRIVTASLDGTARVWDAASGRLLATLSGHTGLVSEARFSADGTRILTTHSDDTPCLWDAATGQLLARPFGDASLLRGALLNPNGSHLVTYEGNGTVRIWTHRLWEPLHVQLASWSAGRDLTCEEHVLYLHAKRDCPPSGSPSEKRLELSKALTALKSR